MPLVCSDRATGLHGALWPGAAAGLLLLAAVSPGRASSWQYGVFPVTSFAGFTSAYGMRLHPLGGDLRPHLGIDIAAPEGSAVRSWWSGQVQEVTDDLRNYRVDFTKIQRVLGFRCVVPLDEGVREMVEAVRRGEVTNWRDPIYSNVKTLQQAGGLEVLKFERPEDKLPQEMPATQRFLKKAG